MVDERLARLRIEYETVGLISAETDSDPICQFERWLSDAIRAGVEQANAMTLATADSRGRPSARVVLLKSLDHDGFVFYTNLESRKSDEILVNPWAALCVVWLELHRQVRIEGPVTPVSDEEADEYFGSRPKEARIAATASPQSREIPDRQTLMSMVEAERRRFGDQDIPKPGHWGGWRVSPHRMEFWQGRLHRLHDRLVYTRAGEEGWRRMRLAP